jgi:hypothetical protein
MYIAPELLARMPALTVVLDNNVTIAIPADQYTQVGTWFGWPPLLSLLFIIGFCVLCFGLLSLSLFGGRWRFLFSSPPTSTGRHVVGRYSRCCRCGRGCFGCLFLPVVVHWSFVVGAFGLAFGFWPVVVAAAATDWMAASTANTKSPNQTHGKSSALAPPPSPPPPNKTHTNTTTTTTQEFRVPEVDVPLRALKIVRGGRFVLGQTALNHVYFEIDRKRKSIGFAKCVR